MPASQYDAAVTGTTEQPRKRRRWRRWLWPPALVLAALLIADRLFPPPLPRDHDGGTVVLAADGRPLRAFADSEGVWRTPITLDQVSPLYLEALLAYEDRRFRWHPGIDPLAVGRAGWQALSSGRVVSGGSTLTMQVARILEPPSRRRSWTAKLRQSLRALQLEWRLSKDEILALYLNHAPYGGTIEGVAAASWAYLGKAPDQLSHAEAALLVVLPQAPSRTRPDRHAERARVARDKVLERMVDLGQWPAPLVTAARDEPVISRQLRVPVSAALLAERLRRQDRHAGRIETLIDADLQAQVEARVEAWLQRLPPAMSAAVLIMDNADLSVRAYLGSGVYGDPDRAGHVDMIAARRSPGSTLKPFLYGLALDDGLIHSESLLVDAPQSFDGYRPANFDTGFRGPVSAAEALRLSLNVPAVDLLDRIGPARFSARLDHAGLRLRLPRGAEPNLAMILGGTATTLEELVMVYSALGRGGLAGQPRLRPQDPRRERRLMSAGAAFITRDMLREPLAPGSAAASLARQERLIAKTGTSWGYRDTWAIGVQPGWTLGVWIGRPDGTPVPGQYGAITALPLLQSIADGLPRRDDRDFARSAGAARATICWPLGTEVTAQAPALCSRQREAWVLDGVVPATLPDRHALNAARIQRWWTDSGGQRRDPDCAGNRPLNDVQAARWPVLAGPWLSHEQRRASEPPPWASDCRGDGEREPRRGLVLTGLHDGTTLKPAPGGNGIAQIAATAHGAASEISWLINDRLVGQSRNGAAQHLVFPGPGRYRVVALDRSGSHQIANVQVIR